MSLEKLLKRNQYLTLFLVEFDGNCTFNSEQLIMLLRNEAIAWFHLVQTYCAT